MNIFDLVVGFVDKLGYLGIGLLMLLENIFPPIPSELIMPLAGFLVGRGEMAFIPTVLAGLIGTVIGSLPWYYLGRALHQARLAQLLDRYGKYIALSVQDLERANSWFNRHGNKAVLICRLVPGVRTLISLPAGMNSMPIGTFLFYTTIGATLWTALLTAAGMLLGENYELVDEYVGPLSNWVVILLVLAAIGFICYRLFKAHTK